MSGMPNPAWYLAEAEESEVLRLLSQGWQAPITDEQPPVHLGYRGFVLELGDMGSDLPSRIRIFGGVLRENGSAIGRKAGPALERFLVSHAPVPFSEHLKRYLDR